MFWKDKELVGDGAEPRLSLTFKSLLKVLLEVNHNK